MGRLFCKYCGKPTDEDSKYCMHCGKLLNYSNNPNITCAISENMDQQEKHQNTQGEQTTLTEATDYPSSSKSNLSKYDESHEKDGIPVVVGIVGFFIHYFILFELQDISIVVGITVVWRIVAASWVISIARKLNRDTTGWGVAAFMAPSIFLILIALQKKLNPDYLAKKKEHFYSKYT